jgi:integrase
MTVLYKPGKGWMYRFWHTPTRPKSPYERVGLPTKRAAQEAEWAKKREVGYSRRRGLGAPTLFGLAAREYLARVVSMHANPRGERVAFRLFEAHWGSRPLSSLTYRDVDEYKAWRKAQPRRRRGKGPVAGATVNRELAYLSAFYTWAQGQDWHLPDGYNPGRAAPRRPDRERRPGVERYEEPWRPWQTLPADLEARFWSVFPSRERLKGQLLLELGVRKGVVLDLEWTQIDWANRLLHFTSKGKSKVHPLSDRALELLQTIGPRATGRLFAERTDTTLRRYWAKAVRAIELKGLRRHDLRVTFARRLANEGADLKTIASLLSHSTIVMASRYIPADLQVQRDALARLDRRSGLRSYAGPTKGTESDREVSGSIEVGPV